MKAVAKHWLNYNGVWYKGGDEFDVDDFEAVREHADMKKDGFVSEVFPPNAEQPEQPRTRGRKKKTETN